MVRAARRGHHGARACQTVLKGAKRRLTGYGTSSSCSCPTERLRDHRPDSRWLATGSADCTARIFEVASGQELCRVTDCPGVNDVAFSPDGRWLGGSGKITRIWDATSGEELLGVSSDGCGRVAFSPDGCWTTSCGSGDCAKERMADRSPRGVGLRRGSGQCQAATGVRARSPCVAARAGCDCRRRRRDRGSARRRGRSTPRGPTSCRLMG